MSNAAATYHLIGDVHGCYTQLVALLQKLGYHRPDAVNDPWGWHAPAGCQAVFVGDLVDRGPDPLGCIRVLARMVALGQASWVLGNHEIICRQLLRFLLGKSRKPGKLAGGTLPTWVGLLGCEPNELFALLQLIDNAPCYLELVADELIVVHARWEAGFAALARNEQLLACAGGESNEDDRTLPDDIFALPEPTVAAGSGVVDLDLFAALAERARWVRRWKGPAWVVWGHQVVRGGQVARIGRTIAVDSGCCLGFALSAYIWPSGEVVQVAGDRLWRERLQRYADAGELIFPASHGTIARRIQQEQLRSAGDYLAYLVDALARLSVPPPWPALADAHARIFMRLENSGLLTNGSPIANPAPGLVSEGS